MCISYHLPLKLKQKMSLPDTFVDVGIRHKLFVTFYSIAADDLVINASLTSLPHLSRRALG
jgi:hypothetical protein